MKNNQGPLSKDEMAFLFKFAAENGIKAKKPIESKHQVSQSNNISNFSKPTINNSSNPFGVKLKPTHTTTHEAPLNNTTTKTHETPLKPTTTTTHTNPFGGKTLVTKQNDLVPEAIRKKVQQDEDKLMNAFMGSGLVKEVKSTNPPSNVEQRSKVFTKAETVANVNPSKNVFREMAEKDKNITSNNAPANQHNNLDNKVSMFNGNNSNQKVLDRFSNNKTTVHQQNVNEHKEAFPKLKPVPKNETTMAKVEPPKSVINNIANKFEPKKEDVRMSMPIHSTQPQKSSINNITNKFEPKKEDVRQSMPLTVKYEQPKSISNIASKFEPKKEDVRQSVPISVKHEQPKPINNIVSKYEPKKEDIRQSMPLPVKHEQPKPVEIYKIEHKKEDVRQSMPIQTKKIEEHKPINHFVSETKKEDIRQSMPLPVKTHNTIEHKKEENKKPIEPPKQITQHRKVMEKQMTLQNVSHISNPLPKNDVKQTGNASPKNKGGINALIQTLARNMEERNKPKVSAPVELQKDIKVEQSDNMKNLLSQMNAHFEAPKDDTPVTVVSGTGPGIPPPPMPSSAPPSAPKVGGPGVPLPPPMLPTSQVVKVPPKKIIPKKEVKKEQPKKKVESGPSLMDQLKMVQLKKNK